MRIALAHPGDLPAARYGGTERVVWDLARALSDMGHEVTLVARRITAIPPFRTVEAAPDELIRAVPSDCDVLHLHFDPGTVELPRPAVVTQHGNISAGPIHVNSVFVSADHARRHGSRSWVHNGLDWRRFPRPDLDARRSGVHFLGKAAWSVKNLAGAIRVTGMARRRLDVLGGHRVNFSMGLRITLSPRVRFHGMADDARKAAVLQSSEALVFPVLWHEPFGLAVIESLFMGCLVFATTHGALPEIIHTGSHGLLSNSRSELAAAIAEPRRHGDRRACHERAATAFSAERMARDYIQRYERVLAGERLNPMQPTGSSGWRNLGWLP